MELLVIEVHGVPCIPPRDRMVDQLKIHFLKRRNSGGDVLTVIYPTSTPGQAYVIFESAEVPGVLECTHFLDVDSRFYLIHVKKAHLSEVDMPIRTTLDLAMFPNPESVLKLLKHYEFNVGESIPGHLELMGSFLKLKLIRNQLLKLQGHDHQLHNRAPLSLHNGSSSGYDMEHTSLDSRFDSKSTSSNIVKIDAVSQRCVLDNTSSLSSSYRDLGYGGSPRSLQHSHSSYTERNARSPVDAVVQNSKELLAHGWSPLPNSASSLSTNSRLHNTSELYRDSVSGGFSRHLLSSQYSSIGSTGHAVDNDVLMQQQNVMSNEMHAHRWSPLFDVSSSSSSSSKNSISSPSQQHHTSYSHSASGGSLRRRRSFDGDTWATCRDDDVKLVGSTRGSFEVMQKIQGKSDNPHRGRSMERSSNSRRCSSLHRQYKLAEPACITDRENQSSAANKYSSSYYQSDEGKALQIVRGSEQTSGKNSHRTRSNSESRGKNRTNREQAIQDMELVSSNQGEKSSVQKTPELRKMLNPNHITREFRKQIHKISNLSAKK